MEDVVTIREILVPALEAAFPDRGLRVSSPPEAVAVFTAVCPEVGDVLIYDDEEEATVVIEHVTHHHVNPYNANITQRDRAMWVTNEVIEFLRELFADRVLLWSHQLGAGSSGWQRPYDGEIPKEIPRDAHVFLWSRRLQ